MNFDLMKFDLMIIPPKTAFAVTNFPSFDDILILFANPPSKFSVEENRCLLQSNSEKVS